MAKARTRCGGALNKKKTRLWQAILAVVVLGAMVAAYVLRNQGAASDDSGSASGQQTDLPTARGALRDRLVLPAKPANPRPITLNPTAFTDPEVQQAYQAAKDTPEPIENMACYCGCFATAGHRNNLDCFHDNHGMT